MPQSAAEKTAALMAALWQRNLPAIRERLDLLQAASSAAASGNLSEPLRSEAAAAAHKLAGSVGMYGFTEATPVARELEAILVAEVADAAPSAAAVVEATRLQQLTAQLRSALAL